DLATGWQAGIALALTLSIRRTRTRAGAGMAHNPVLCLFGLRRGTVVQHKHCDDGGVIGSSGQGSRIERGGNARWIVVEGRVAASLGGRYLPGRVVPVSRGFRPALDHPDRLSLGGPDACALPLLAGTVCW